MMSEHIGADSNCFSFIIDAMTGISRPTDDLADQKIALFRIYLYVPGTLYATPKVRAEIAAIRDPARRAHHESFFTSLFSTVAPTDLDRVAELTNVYATVHPSDSDCRIIAEATAGELCVFLSFDHQLVRNLSSYAQSIRLVRPSDFWISLNVPRGIRPTKSPAPTNPLKDQSWWVW